MVDTYTKRPIYELTGKNNKRYFLYWIKTDMIKTIEYPRSRAGNKDGWIVRNLFCFILLNFAEKFISICISINLIVIIEFIITIIQISQKIGSFHGILKNIGNDKICPTEDFQDNWQYWDKQWKSDATFSVFCKGTVSI